MRIEEDFNDLTRKLRMRGVSPAWRVVGILTSIAAGLFLLICIVLAVALAARPPEVDHERIPSFQPAPFGQNQPPQINIPQFNGGEAADQDPEPPNPPYPVVADLQTDEQKARLGKLTPKKDKPTPHERFVALGQEIWVSPVNEYPQHFSLSPDGRMVAYVSRQVLYVGRIDGEVQAVPLDATGAAPPAGRIGTPVGSLAWSDLGRGLYFADSEGRLIRYQPTIMERGHVQPLDFHGDCPLPMPNNSNQLIYRRSRAFPKIEGDNGVPQPDPTEIVLRDLQTRQTRVLIPENRDAWTPLAVSPNGKWLVLSSTRGVDKKKFGHERLYLLSLPADKPVEPKETSLVIRTNGSVCWESNSTAFVYSRDQDPMPPDCYETTYQNYQNGSDLFRYDVELGRETRLSRGGGFESPTLDGHGNLLFVERKFQPETGHLHLHRVALATALRFAEREPNLRPREAAEWSRFFDGVLTEANIPADARGEKLNPESLLKIAVTFTKNFREQLKAEPPRDEEGWKKLRQELSNHVLTPAARRTYSLVLGACEGEFLRHKHGAAWRLSPGPLRQLRFILSEPQESPFGYVFNPFDSALMGRDEDDEGEGAWGQGLLSYAVGQARGRPIILANNAAEGAKATEQFADPKLAQAVDMLKQKKLDEADRLLLEMMKDKKHERNDSLAVHVARLLHEHRRFAAMRQLLEQRIRIRPDSPKYNLLGLAELDSNPKEAAGHFKTALRYDLNYAPAYLNLSHAYQKMNEVESARWCLIRCLKLMPYGPSAQDARQRLAALNGNED